MIFQIQINLEIFLKYVKYWNLVSDFAPLETPYLMLQEQENIQKNFDELKVIPAPNSPKFLPYGSRWKI